ncbi:MAG: 1-acyl-sn-glycerol-3-phosphate acyltransferase [Acholeplasmatales bacterium]|nr:1-acyl-sn-glycerol-3-phosphate acyltransferase [Acholeplasmatales bacterium]
MKNKKGIIPIFFACDDKYVKFTMVTLKSIMENASNDYNYKAYILNTDIKEETKKKFKSVKKDNFTVEYVDVNKYYESIESRLPVRDYYNKTTYFRFFIAEMFNEYDKAIYIDSDTIVLGDISKFYEHDLENNYVGACNEQAMLQSKVFGDYVEEVCGVKRDEFFNAGLLLINSKLFREDCVLDQFINLLGVYRFTVTQDEDYLNVICNNKVKWIHNSWNTEIYGTIPYKDNEINMIHYIMWGKPWHIADAPLAKYFWKYCKMTPSYGEILNILNNYTEEQVKKDMEASKKLEELALAETLREDSYLKLKEENKIAIHSIDRLRIMKKIRDYELTGRFSEDVEQDPPSREIKPGEVDYLKEKVSSKMKTKFAYFIARRFLNKIIREKQMIIKDIEGIENLKNLETGAILTCNHFNAFDSFAIQVAYEASITKGKERRKKRFYRVIREGNYTSFPGFYGFLMRNCYTLPLASNQKAMQQFMRSTNKLLQKGNLVLVYPEQSMWWNYKKPKPLQKGAFQFAVKADVPVVPCFITMKDSDIVGKDGFMVQEYTIHIGKPIKPNAIGNNQEKISYMMEENYRVWKEIYERIYQQKLVYSQQAM